MYSEIWPQIQLEEGGSWQIIRIWSPGMGMCGNVNLEKCIKTKSAEEEQEEEEEFYLFFFF